MAENRLDKELAEVLGPARLAYYAPIHHNPALADRKAAFLLGATGLICTVLLLFSGAIARLLESPWAVLRWGVLLLLVAIGALLLVGAAIAWHAFTFPTPSMPASWAFYRDIAARPREEYAQAVKALGHRQALRDMLHYNYSLAVQGAAKFRIVGQAFKCFRIALILWLIVLLVISVGG